MVAPIYKFLNDRLDEIVRENMKKDTPDGAVWHGFIESADFEADWFDKTLLKHVRTISKRHGCSYMCALVSVFEWLKEFKDYI